jgi:acetyl-CoA carboxylase biotin carboxyl carrier protein
MAAKKSSARPAARPAKKAPASSKPQAQSPELALISSMAEILNATGLTEIELEQKGVRFRVSKAVSGVSYSAPVMSQAPAPSATAPVAAATAVAAAPASDGANAVKSPMVGTAYLAASPEAAPFVAIGTKVKEGQTVLIIEAMKTMNQIPAPRSGTVTRIMVENGQPVEFGEAMMVIE